MTFLGYAIFNCGFHCSCCVVDVQDGATISSFISAVRDQVTSNKSYGHPYRYELEQFEPTAEQLELKDPQVKCLNRIF